MQEQCGKELSTRKKDRDMFFLRKKQQGDRDHSGVNQSKIIKPAMLIN